MSDLVPKPPERRPWFYDPAVMTIDVRVTCGRCGRRRIGFMRLVVTGHNKAYGYLYDPPERLCNECGEAMYTLRQLTGEDIQPPATRWRAEFAALRRSHV